jgi:hypothetical protein
LEKQLNEVEFLISGLGELEWLVSEHSQKTNFSFA